MTEETKIVTISPVTTAKGTLNDRGIIPEGTRLKDIPVEQFSPKWMEVVTQVDRKKVNAHLKAKAAAKAEADGPTKETLQAEIDNLKDQVRSLNGSVGALTQKVDQLTAAKKAGAAGKTPAKPAAKTSG